jgi:hypothetical protein
MILRDFSKNRRAININKFNCGVNWNVKKCVPVLYPSRFVRQRPVTSARWNHKNGAVK